MVSISGERLTRTIRNHSFRAPVRHYKGYINEKKISVDAVKPRLATPTSIVEGATGGRWVYLTFSSELFGLPRFVHHVFEDSGGRHGLVSDDGVHWFCVDQVDDRARSRL